ncbi:MAG: PQQ-binding-like beta-propeller repeat protein [Verrucomicrobiales bacterium]|nr:PQQ-binding-like beta-propeller repeat protein [Verrucomicrobiales bacterium]
MKVAIALLTSTFLLSSARADLWPQFRGPSGDGIAPAENVPSDFGEEKNVTWKTRLPGRGWSSPVFDGENFWLTTAIEIFPSDDERIELLKAEGVEEKHFKVKQVASKIELTILQVNATTGEIVSRKKLAEVEKPQAIHSLNSFASPTPVLSGKTLIAHFGTFGTFAVDTASGHVLWERTIELEHSVGPGSSPVVVENLLILICDGVDQQFVTALDVASGQEAWKTDRPAMRAAKGDQKKAYSTPVLITDRSGRDQLICMGSQWLVSYEPKTGKEIWRFDHGNGFSVVPRPVFSPKHQLVYISTGFGKPVLKAIHVDGKGDITDQDKVAWEDPKRIPAKPSPLLIGDELYIISDGGVGSCFDAATGKLHWNARIDGNYSASPLFADGKIYVGNQEGTLTVFAPGKSYEKLVENQIEGSIMASPLALDGALILRSDTALYRFSD